MIRSLMISLSVVLAATSSRSAYAADALSVADFLPKGFVKDGSVSYQPEIQRAVDTAAEQKRRLIVPPMVYLVDECGIRLRSGISLQMDGAVFLLDSDREQDGAVFIGQDLTDVVLSGGEIAGRNDAWPDGVNIRGVFITGRSARIRVRGMHIHDLSSNGIGVFGDDGHPIRDVTISDVVVENCCNRYPEYLSDEKWEAGSTREDQGLVALYHVEGFTVRDCRLERSRSDGTHFYKCRRGQIVNNRISRAKMGGYFLETCRQVIGSGNIVRENGSRGATIERGSKGCVFTGNCVSLNGREGLWAPDCVGLIVANNIFDRNGRKPNGPQRRYLWNANITINEAESDPTKSPTRDYLISNNLIYTTKGQIAAIRIDAGEATSGIVIQNNVLRGENARLLLQGARKSNVVLSNNRGSATKTFAPAREN